MIKKNELTAQQTVRYCRLQAWTMSFICTMLTLFAAVAVMRIPHYLAVADYARLMSTILFALLAQVGLLDNIHTHIGLWQLEN